jgi:hypothetical protein
MLEHHALRQNLQIVRFQQQQWLYCRACWALIMRSATHRAVILQLSLVVLHSNIVQPALRSAGAPEAEPRAVQARRHTLPLSYIRMHFRSTI